MIETRTTTIYRCDSCGKEIEPEDRLRRSPKGWKALTMSTPGAKSVIPDSFTFDTCSLTCAVAALTQRWNAPDPLGRTE